jgi:predicted RNase H-like nuclease (RuvC/YqgF family)
MAVNEISSLKTDIALIQKDVKQIERVFTKVDNAVEQMSEILKTIAVQENILENNEKRVTSLEETIKKRNDEEEQFRKEFARKLDDMKETSQKERERHHRELLESIENLNKSVNDKLDNQDKRIRSLENWRWYLLGIGAVLLFIVNKLPWEAFFG